MKSTSPVTHRSYLSLNAPAKINWFLRITGKRADGYHNIVSLMQCISLSDQLTIEHADTIAVEDDLNIPLRDNLIYKAASFLKGYTSYPSGARITLKKNIPVSAGVGGGSSDAATTLAGLNTFWDLHLSKEELSSIGARIGSDVPFFLNAPSALVEGRGEKTTPVSISAQSILLLVNPDVPISTAWAYTYYDKLHEAQLTKKPIDIKLFCQALNRQDFTALGKILRNDLEEVVTERYPAVREIRNKLLQTGAVISAMSGSGPTVYGVFRSKAAARRAAKLMQPYSCWVTETLISIKS